jgi:hypothetical protein
MSIILTSLALVTRVNVIKLFMVVIWGHDSITTLSIRMLCHYAECHVLFIVMLNVVMLSVVAMVID